MKKANFIRIYSKRLMKSPGVRNETLRPVIAISLTGVILGVCAMLLSVMVVTGYREEITGKVTGFVANFRIRAFSNNESYEEKPILIDRSTIEKIKSLKGVNHIQAYANKAGLMKTTNDIQGIVLKGADTDYKWDFFESKITQGRKPGITDSAISNEVLISENISQKLSLKPGDNFLLFFIQNDRKVRKLKVSGIYKTGLGEDFDNLFLIGDLKLIKQVNGWKKEACGGYELYVDNKARPENILPDIYSVLGYEYEVKSAKELYPQMFSWLELQNMNVIIIICLISLVAGITLLSTLLIIVMRNTREIGILKTIGAGDNTIGRIFGLVAFRILIKGLIIANCIVIAVGLVQKRYGLVKLPEDSYYLSQVPVHFSISGFLIINLVVLLSGLMIMMLPARIIGAISPVKVLRFD